uniref:Macrophage-expressed gene 1 protein n=1 Tax=Panagrolaimus sp. ES5 TaxID=591445 RepID=A0AC34FG94_9BILA
MVLLLLLFLSIPAFSAAILNDTSLSSTNDPPQQLSNVNACLKSAKTIPNNLLNGRTLAGIVGYGWDDLQSTVTKPIFAEEFKACQAEPTGAFLLPDNVIATPLLQTSLDRMAEFCETFNEFRQKISNSFSASAKGKYHLFSASGTFSTKHQESKENFAKYKSSLLRSKLIYKSFNLYRDPVGSLEAGFIDRIEQLSDAIFRNLTYRPQYLAQMIVKDFGTHYISTADTGAIIEQEIFIDSNHQFTVNTTLDSVRASAAAGFGSYFGAKAEGTHEVTTESKQTLSKITKHSKISTSGGPNVNSVLSFSDNGTLLVDNLVSFNHDGDWLYEIVVPRNFPLIDSSIIFTAQIYLKNAIELYYRKNTIRGCMDMNAPNYNFEANLDDGTCEFNNDSYPFGGVYQTCVPIKKQSFIFEIATPEWRCDGLKQDNLFIGKPGCEDALFEPVKLLDEIYGFEDRIEKHVREECETTFLFFEDCWDVYYDVIYKDAVKVEAFWCRKKANVEIPPEKGAMFGGLFEEGKANEFTGAAECPGSYQPYHLGRHVTLTASISDTLAAIAKFRLPPNNTDICKNCEAAGGTVSIIWLFIMLGIFAGFITIAGIVLYRRQQRPNALPSAENLRLLEDDANIP